MKLFSLPARTGRLQPTDDEGTVESMTEVPAWSTTATLPEGLTTSSNTSGIISSASLCSSSEATPPLSATPGGDSIANSRRVCVATSHGGSDNSRPQATETKCRMTGLSKPCASRGTESNRFHHCYIVDSTSMTKR